MSADRIHRRSFVGGGLMALAGGAAARAQGFAGLGGESDGFAQVTPGKVLTFPRDLGPHPDYRIEWWYLTANLRDVQGHAFGAQWTLFRQAMTPGSEGEGWDSRQIWMGHAAVTSADEHRYAEKFARGGVGQAGCTETPFNAWIDSWQIFRQRKASEAFAPQTIAPLTASATGADFSYTLDLAAAQPLVLQGDSGYSRKSERGQASYYFSQPYFMASGTLAFGDKSIAVTGHAWMDREWSSQPLASDQTGWDWFSLHLDERTKLMLFRLRQKDGRNYFAGNWIAEGYSEQLPETAIVMTPLATTAIGERKLPTAWRIEIASRALSIETVPLNARSWMGTRFSYWEGPIGFRGSHSGVGYLEMTGY